MEGDLVKPGRRSPRPRVLVGGMFLESHSFAPLKTTRKSFIVTEGTALVDRSRNSESILAGGIRALEAGGAGIIPAFCAVAPPGGLADHATYVAFRDAFIDAAVRNRPDGVLLELHGAMATDEIDDTEGDLVGRLREAVGRDVPIAVGLDMHASISEAMLAATPLWVSCKENPHTDYASAGARAAELLMATIAGKIAPVTCAVWLPMLLRGKLGTGSGPLAAMHALRRAAEGADGIADISIYNTYAFIDAAAAGQCLTVTAEGRSSRASEIVEDLARTFWQERGAFDVDRPSPAEVFATISPGSGPVVVGDHGDRVLGGSAGDGTFLIHLLGTEFARLRALVPVTDPAAVSCAERAGVGATIERALGGGLTGGEPPVVGPWTVKALGDGRFVQQGPFLANEPAAMGPTAVLTRGNLTVLATTRPAFSQDPACFLSNGEDPACYDVVVCKSGFHFEPAFASYGRCVAVETPGMTNYVPGQFSFKRRPPLWPEDPSVVPDFAVLSYPPQPSAVANPGALSDDFHD